MTKLMIINLALMELILSNCNYLRRKELIRLLSHMSNKNLYHAMYQALTFASESRRHIRLVNHAKRIFSIPAINIINNEIKKEKNQTSSWK